jgi:hypothetical protein
VIDSSIYTDDELVGKSILTYYVKQEEEDSVSYIRKAMSRWLPGQ